MSLRRTFSNFRPLLLNLSTKSKQHFSSTMAFNYGESKATFVPKQALAPTPDLYDELVGSGFTKLAAATLERMPKLSDGAVIHDNGCGTGGSAEAIVAAAASQSAKVSIKATDINDRALEIFTEHATTKKWPVEAINMDAASLTFKDDTFTQSIANGIVFMLPNDGIDAVKEMHRTLKPGGTIAVNSWASVPNLQPIQATAEATRPAGTPLPRAGAEKWNDPVFLQSIVEKGGFKKENIKVVQEDVFLNVGALDRYARMLWSFVGGTGAKGWLESDEEKWEEAIGVLKKQLLKHESSRLEDGGSMRLKFVGNIAIATK